MLDTAKDKAETKTLNSDLRYTLLSMAPSLPHPRFTFCADTGGGASLTVLWTSPAYVGI